ncbi:hypothetical protein IMG5_154910, partial [Ichthyophthirius multifiliis]
QDILKRFQLIEESKKIVNELLNQIHESRLIEYLSGLSRKDEKQKGLQFSEKHYKIQQNNQKQQGTKFLVQILEMILYFQIQIYIYQTQQLLVLKIFIHNMQMQQYYHQQNIWT